jgi:hypothetical protein
MADLVVPELQRIGLVRTERRTGTFRGRLLGAGDRLPPSHPAAPYRVGGYNLVDAIDFHGQTRRGQPSWRGRYRRC